MRKVFILLFTSLALMSMAMLPTPAAAIDIGGAATACARNPHCSQNKDVGDGWLELNITQSDGHISVVQCPPKGSCSCVGTCKTAGGGKTTATSTVEGVLKASGPGMAKTPTTPTKITEDKKKIKPNPGLHKEPEDKSKKK